MGKYFVSFNISQQVQIAIQYRLVVLADFFFLIGGWGTMPPIAPFIFLHTSFGQYNSDKLTSKETNFLSHEPHQTYHFHNRTTDYIKWDKTTK